MATPAQGASECQNLSLYSPRDTYAVGRDQADSHVRTLRVRAALFLLGLHPPGLRQSKSGKVAWPIRLQHMPLSGIAANEYFECVCHILSDSLHVSSEPTMSLCIKRRQDHCMVVVPLNEYGNWYEGCSASERQQSRATWQRGSFAKELDCNPITSQVSITQQTQHRASTQSSG